MPRASSTKEVCKVADSMCEQPANYDDGRLRLPLCYRCGEAVCRRCSLLCVMTTCRVQYRRRVRLCADCYEEEIGKLPTSYLNGEN